MMPNLDTFLYAFLGGVLPAIVWLIFWLREDKNSPEPKRLIALTFILGMVSVVLVLPFQKLVDKQFPGIVIAALVLWVILEEVFKFIAGYMGGLSSEEDNEPIDPLIYMITAALGFSALENVLFVFQPLLLQDTVLGIITGNLRFVGASLLHVVSSGIIGAALGFSFYQRNPRRIIMVCFSLVLAIAFHLTFNLLIIHLGEPGTMIALGMVWTGVVLLLLAFEKAKYLKR
jgi:RsiW-degrading membrane proteinase PrsW (M82 family)